MIRYVLLLVLASCAFALYGDEEKGTTYPIFEEESEYEDY